MDFELTEFQTDLAEGVRRLCEGRFPLESIRTAEGSDQVVDKKGWRELGDAGVCTCSPSGFFRSATSSKSLRRCSRHWAMKARSTGSLAPRR